jgi:hypothetical protein
MKRIAGIGLRKVGIMTGQFGRGRESKAGRDIQKAKAGRSIPGTRDTGISHFDAG